MSSRWVCAACGGWCEMLTEENSFPKACPYHDDEITEWESIDEDEEEEEE